MINWIEISRPATFFEVNNWEEYQQVLNICYPCHRATFDGVGIYIHYDDVLRRLDRTEIPSYRERCFELLEWFDQRREYYE